MNLKQAVIKVMSRDDLKAVVDSLELTTVDRRDRTSMAKSVGKRRDIGAEYLLGFLAEAQVKEVCEKLGVEATGRKNALVEMLLTREGNNAAGGGDQDEEDDETAPQHGKAAPPVPAPNGRRLTKLTLAQLERHLFGAADILRGKMDASEFKEFIFGMLFLKRASDQFEAQRDEVLEAQLQKGRSQAEAEKRADSPTSYTDTFFVPERARWGYIRDNSRKANVGDLLNKALSALEEENPGTLEDVLRHIDFTRKVGKSRIPDQRLQVLIDHFNRYRLRNEDFEFPDLLGAAYEYLIGEFADSAGKKGGEFYTPRAVVRMMVRLAEPQEGMKVYDPCSGSGGMLILSHEYVAERGGNPRNLALFGQELNGGVWSISKMNMLLHGIADADIANNDKGTLEDPAHLDGGELMRFDRVISNPPFSQNYNDEGIPFPERFQYGMCPTSGKKADLMFVQHMLAVLKPQGLVATVMPHGVLFRGGAEKQIRQGFILADLLDSVIGLAPNLFYGTGIPACILVLRAKGAKPKDRRGKVLFINADAEHRAGRAQNYLEPEHIEKIVNAYRSYQDIPGFAAVVSHEELQKNDFNLNIRRYADNAPPPEPQDVRAHLLGGVPKAEVEAQKELFAAHGFDPRGLFVGRDEKYLDFAPAVAAKADLKRLVEGDAGLKGREAQVQAALDRFWKHLSVRIESLPKDREIMKLRSGMLEGFDTFVTPVGLLDRFKVTGVLATWWNEAQFDLKTLAARGFSGVVEGWVATISHALEEDGNKTDPLEHKLVKKLLPEFTEEIAEAGAKVAEFESQKAEFEQQDSEGDEESDGDEDAIDNYGKWLEKEIKATKARSKEEFKRLAALTKTTPSGSPGKGSIGWMEANGMDTRAARHEAEGLKARLAPVELRLKELEKEVAPYREIKARLSEEKKKLKALKASFVERLAQAQVALDAEQARVLVLDLLKADLAAVLDRAVTAHRQAIVSRVETWWDKYRVTLRDIEGERDEAKKKVDGFLKELGYGS